MKFWEAMKALDEGKKIRKKHWRDPDFFLIKKTVQFDDHSQIEIKNHVGGAYSFSPGDDFFDVEWEIVEEPKPKIKRWLWAYRSNHQDGFSMTYIFYSDDEAIETIQTPPGKYTKLLWSETEFDE